jgi:hypothetical protein
MTDSALGLAALDRSEDRLQQRARIVGRTCIAPKPAWSVAGGSCLIGHSCEPCAVRDPLCEFWFDSERVEHARAQGARWIGGFASSMRLKCANAAACRRVAC